MGDSVEYRIAERIAWITLNRPDNHNALSDALTGELDDAVHQANADDGVRFIVLGAKGKTFCAGADIKAAGQGTVGGGGLHGPSPYVSILNQLLDGPKPVVGRIQGGAFGGGLGLVTACDIIVAAESVPFAYSEVRLGVAPWMLSVVLQRKGVLTASAPLMLTGERFDAHKAQEINLVHKVVPDEALDQAVREEIEKLLACGPKALQDVKRIAQTIPALSLQEGFAFAERASAALFGSDEGREGMAAFREKRKPQWMRE